MKGALLAALRSLIAVLAVLVIGLALAFALARAFVHEARPWVETWAENQLGHAVHVGDIDLTLVRGRPALALDDVILLGDDGEPVLSFSRLQLQLALLESALQGGLRSEAIILSGLTLNATRSLRLSAPPGATERREAALTWLLGQSHVEIREARLHLDGKPALEDIDLSLRRVGQDHRIEGRARAAGGGGHVALAGDLATADAPHEPARWRGLGEVRVQGLQIEALAQALALPEELRGRADLDLRLRAEAGVLALQGEAALRRVGTQGHTIWRDLHGPVAASLADGAWSLDTTLRGAAPPHTGNALVLNAAGDQERTRMRLERLQADEVHVLAQTLAQVLKGREEAPTLAQYLVEAQPRAELTDLEAVRMTGGRWSYGGAFSEFQQDAWGAVPAVAGVSGRLRFGPQGGEVDLDTGAVALTFPRLFRAPLRFDRIQGPLALREDARGWRIEAQEVAVENAHAAARASGHVRIPRAGGAPQIDLRVAVARADPNSVPAYLPTHIMPEKVVEWLDGAFRDGRVPAGGEVLYSGGLNRFPPPGGRFQARFRVQGLTLAFDPAWPALREVEAQLEFTDLGMRVRDASGRMLSSKVSQGQAHIDDLRSPLLVLNARADGPAGDLLRVARETPLSGPLHFAQDNDLSLAGRSGVALSLKLPLSGAAAARQAPQWAGAVSLREARLARGGFALQRVAGEVAFEGETVSAQNLTAQLWDSPVRGSLQADAETGLRAQLAGEVPALALAQGLGLPQGVLAGTAGWTGVLAVDPRGAWSASAHSDLQGVAVALPEPLGKRTREQRSARLSASGAPEQAGDVSLQYGVHAARLRWRDAVVVGAEVALGGGAASLPPPQDGVVRVRGDLERLALRGWPRLGAAASAPRAGAALRWDVDLERLGLLVGEAPPAGAVAALAEQQAHQAAGTVQAAGAPFNPARLPAAELRVAALSYDGLGLGTLRARLRPLAHGAELSELTLSGGLLTGAARAEWSRGAHGEAFSLTGDMQSRNLAAVSRALGFREGLDARQARVEGSLYWGGPPWRVDPGGLHGTLRVDLREGVLSEVEPGAGRLVGLLGLSALPRRLRLDFRDVFYEGFRFDEAGGSVRFAGGAALTEDFRMSGPAARITVQGRADLVAREYDHLVEVAPRVGQAAPIAGALAWGPQVGAVILIAQQLLKERLDQAIGTRYRITGPWLAPNIETLAQGQVHE